MGNFFSRQPQQYHRMEESMVELETMLNAYDNRLAVCERDSITDRSKIYKLEKEVTKLTDTIKNYDDKILELTNKMETQINAIDYDVKQMKELYNESNVTTSMMNIIDKKFNEKEKWQFELMNKYMEITNDFDEFKKHFVIESEKLAKDGKIVDDDITSHYTALCFICYKINSNILESYFK
jgi:predicted  nucleic acid-binding Zn-ribbon protein